MPEQMHTENIKNRRKLPEIEITETESFNYDGFQVVRGEFFSHVFEPSFTLNKSKVSVNKACIRKLPEIEYVQILVNSTEKKLAVRPCLDEEKDSVRWCSSGEKKNPKQITCRIFYAKVIELMGWNPDNRYKLLGKLMKSNDEYLFIFDLNNPEIYQPKVRSDGKYVISRTPSYPSSWQNQFGVTVEEHKKNLQVNIFDGVAVFGILEPSNKTSSESEV
nr:MAG TPA: hypothetical protein [Caudoviricetes sp.]